MIVHLTTSQVAIPLPISDSTFVTSDKTTTSQVAIPLPISDSTFVTSDKTTTSQVAIPLPISDSTFFTSDKTTTSQVAIPLPISDSTFVTSDKRTTSQVAIPLPIRDSTFVTSNKRTTSLQVHPQLVPCREAPLYNYTRHKFPIHTKYKLPILECASITRCTFSRSFYYNIIFYLRRMPLNNGNHKIARGRVSNQHSLFFTVHLLMDLG